MKFTRSATLGLALIGWLAGCSETETTISVNTRVWTDYLDPGTFKVKLEKDGQSAIDSDFAPRELSAGKYDVVCDHNWEEQYCRWFKRFAVPSWSAGEVKVTISGKTFDGEALKSVIPLGDDGKPKDDVSKVFDLVENEINVVYLEFNDTKTPSPVEPPPPPPPSDAGSDAGDAGEMMTDSGATSDAGADAADGGMDSGTMPDAATAADAATGTDAATAIDAATSVDAAPASDASSDAAAADAG